MAGPTHIEYNGIPIYNVLTEGINQELVRDPTGVDPLYVQVTVDVTGIVYTASSVTAIGLPASRYGVGLAGGFTGAIDDLMQPRRRFIMTVGGVNLFDVVAGHVEPGVPNPNAGDVIPIERTDVNHGPTTSVKLLQFVSANTAKIQFRVVMALPYCDRQGQAPGGIINMRFWIAEDINGEDWTTERTYHGRLRVRHMGHNVLMELRNNFVFPPVVDGFVRKRIGLAQSPNGLELEFTIVDQELWAVPPFPATFWDGFHRVSSSVPEAAILDSEMFLHLKAEKTTPKRQLFNVASKILQAKLHLKDMIFKKQVMITHMDFQDKLPRNEITASVRVKILIENQFLIGIWGEELGKPIPLANYNKEQSHIGRQTASLKGLFLAILQDPCHPALQYGIPTGKKITQQALRDTQVIDQGTLDPADSQLHSDEATQGGFYNFYRLNSTTHTNTGRIQLPYGKSSSGSSATAVFLNVHKPISRRTVIIEAERLEAWPTLPDPDEQFVGLSGSITHWPLSWKMSPLAPQLSVDGRKSLFKIYAEYEYGLDKNVQPKTTGIEAALARHRIQDPSSQDLTKNVYLVPAVSFKTPQGILTA